MRKKGCSGMFRQTTASYGLAAAHCWLATASYSFLLAGHSWPWLVVAWLELARGGQGWLLLLDAAPMAMEGSDEVTSMSNLQAAVPQGHSFPTTVKDDGTKADLSKIGDKIIGKEEKGKLLGTVAHQW